MWCGNSDAISCPLKAYWRLTKLIEQDLDDSNVGILLIGELGHVVLHRNFDAQEKVYMFPTPVGDVHVTIDGVHLANNNIRYPIETKTTRKSINTKEDLLQEWIEQLAIAMSVMDVDKGYLMIMNLITFDLSIWEIVMTKAEQEMVLKAFTLQIMAINDAIEKKNPRLLKPKFHDCHWCGYRPKVGKKGCPFFRDIDFNV
jgi:CRISPR/Cas system-associated exonuclease Cas4 (RecB family)